VKGLRALFIAKAIGPFFIKGLGEHLKLARKKLDHIYPRILLEPVLGGLGPKGPWSQCPLSSPPYSPPPFLIRGGDIKG